jgi:hypothetical protein
MQPVRTRFLSASVARLATLSADILTCGDAGTMLRGGDLKPSHAHSSTSNQFDNQWTGPCDLPLAVPFHTVVITPITLFKSNKITKSVSRVPEENAPGACGRTLGLIRKAASLCFPKRRLDSQCHQAKRAVRDSYNEVKFCCGGLLCLSRAKEA